MTATPSDRTTRRLLIALAVYSAAIVGLLNLHVASAGTPRERAMFWMADGLILLWVVLGGALTPWLRRRLVPRLATLFGGRWRLRFVLLCTLMALIEEAIAVAMTNLAPAFGVAPGEAFITASTNYLDVVLFHSVVIFVPMFAAWAWMLGRWAFAPARVLLLFGLTGALAEATITPWNLVGGFWVFVYGLMAYLPACTVPPDRGAAPPRWWHSPLAVVLPLLAAAPFVPLVIRLRDAFSGPTFLP